MRGRKTFKKPGKFGKLGNRSFTPSTSTMRFWGGVDSGRKGGEGGVVSSSKQMQLGCQCIACARPARRESSSQHDHEVISSRRRWGISPLNIMKWCSISEINPNPSNLITGSHPHTPSHPPPSHHHHLQTHSSHTPDTHLPVPHAPLLHDFSLSQRETQWLATLADLLRLLNQCFLTTGR